jgi:hypothetical protein
MDNMKKLIFITMLCGSLSAAGQNYWFTKTLTTTLDSANLILIYDDGVSKNFTVNTLANLVSDTADVVRVELADTAAQLRSEIGGSSIWTRSGDSVYLTNYATDELLIGTNADNYNDYYKLINAGRTKFELTLEVDDDLTVGGDLIIGTADHYLQRSGDDLWFYDLENTQGYTLSDLASATSHWTLDGTTVHPDAAGYNVLIGATGTTTYDLAVTGDVAIGDELYFNEYTDNTKINSTSSSDLIVTVNGDVALSFKNGASDSIIIYDNIVPYTTGSNLQLGTSARQFYSFVGNRVIIDRVGSLSDSVEVVYPLVPENDTVTIGTAYNRFNDIYIDRLYADTVGSYATPATYAYIKLAHIKALEFPAIKFVGTADDVARAQVVVDTRGGDYDGNMVFDATGLFRFRDAIDGGNTLWQITPDSIEVYKNLVPNGTVNLGSQYNAFDSAFIDDALYVDNLTLESNRIKSSGDLNIGTNGAEAHWTFGSTYFRNQAGTGAWIKNGAPGSSSPSIGPNYSDLNTGLGQNDADELSLIAGGVEFIRCTELDELDGYIELNDCTIVSDKLYADSIYTTKAGAWADYVFSDDYVLPTFTEQVSYFKANNSLPALTLPANQKTFNVARRLEGTIEELEKAYLYINELEIRLSELEKKFESLTKNN